MFDGEVEVVEVGMSDSNKKILLGGLLQVTQMKHMIFIFINIMSNHFLRLDDCFELFGRCVDVILELSNALRPFLLFEETLVLNAGWFCCFS